MSGSVYTPGRFAVIVPPVASPSNEKSPPSYIDSMADMSHSSAAGGARCGRSEWSTTSRISESEPSVKR